MNSTPTDKTDLAARREEFYRSDAFLKLEAALKRYRESEYYDPNGDDVETMLFLVTPKDA